MTHLLNIMIYDDLHNKKWWLTQNLRPKISAAALEIRALHLFPRAGDQLRPQTHRIIRGAPGDFCSAVGFHFLAGYEHKMIMG